MHTFFADNGRTIHKSQIEPVLLELALRKISLNFSLYFLTNYYKTEELNIYVMDFALENLKCFNEAPQIGDVIYLYEKEKIIF